MEPTLTLAVVLVATSVLSVFAALLLAAALEKGHKRSTVAPPGDDAVFLVADGLLVDCNETGSRLLATLQDRAAPDGICVAADSGGATRFQTLLQHLAPSFPDILSHLKGSVAGSATGDGWVLRAIDGSGLILGGADAQGALRLTLSQGTATGTEAASNGEDTVLLDRFSWRALNDELRVLRRTTDAAPTPAWRERADGQIVWANGAYLRLLAEIGIAGPTIWPLPSAFGTTPAAGGRHSVTAGAGGRRRWFDLCVIPEGAERLIFALSADDAQQAERARRDFVQTLTKTFASLPVGLAVFDRTRRLQLFNPALTDLTQLEPEFLASRPGMDGFLNRMRDKRILPEPRDYRTWSRRLLDVETASGGKPFEEIWALPDGRSFRFSVSPHPDGALAFLLEDITSETRLKRSFRVELDLGRAALDMVDTAVVVFSPGGELAITNAAFDQLWAFEGADTLTGVQFADAVANWREIAAENGGDTGLWDRIAALGQTGGGSQRAAGQIVLSEHEMLNVAARPAPGGSVMIAFSPVADGQALTTRPEKARQRATA